MPVPSSRPLALYLFEHHMPSHRVESQKTKPREYDHITGLTYAERARSTNFRGCEAQDPDCESAPPPTVVARIEPENSSELSQDQCTPRRASTIRRQKAQDDLRMSAYCWSKVLPPLPTEVAGVSAFSDSTGNEELVSNSSAPSSQIATRGRDSDSVVPWSKYILRRMKSRYARRVRGVRLSLAWEVEEIV